jgi:GT2 family glycosyltransferase
MRPVFSVIIPTHNRPASLRECLRALARQSCDRDAFEVIVVDDGGFLRSAEWEAEFERHLNLRIAARPQSGPAAARNLGAQSARGEYIAFTDDDCAPEPAWLSALERALRGRGGVLAGGATVNGLTANVYSAASQLLVEFLYFRNTEKGMTRFFTSNNFAMERRAFEAVGGFDESFPLAAAEDREFCARWMRSGRSMALVPETVVRHYHTLTLGGFWRQHFAYGRGAFQFRRRCKARGWPVRLEPTMFYFDLLRYPLRRGSGGKLVRLQTCALFFLSQTANAAGFLREALVGFHPSGHELHRSQQRARGGAGEV